MSGKELLGWHETGHLNVLHRGLSNARIRAHSIAHRAIATLALLPHPQQRRVAVVDEVDDPHIGFAGVLPVASRMRGASGGRVSNPVIWAVRCFFDIRPCNANGAGVRAATSNADTRRAVLRACLQGRHQPVLGPALLAEYEDVLSRSELFAGSVLSTKERGEVFDGLMSRCRWVEVFYAWRPNLPDEADAHLVELAVAAQADAIVMRNLRHVARGELKFPTLRVLTPEQCLEAFPCPP